MKVISAFASCRLNASEKAASVSAVTMGADVCVVVMHVSCSMISGQSRDVAQVAICCEKCRFCGGSTVGPVRRIRLVQRPWFGCGERMIGCAGLRRGGSLALVRRSRTVEATRYRVLVFVGKTSDQDDRRRGCRVP